MSFNDVIELLKIKKPSALKYLEAGKDKHTIDELTNGLDVSIPNELYEIYSVKNGTKELSGIGLGDIWFFPGAYLLSIESAVEVYNKKVHDDYWPNKYFPVFASGTDDYYLINLDTESKIFLMIFYYSPSDADFDYIISYFDSVGACLQTIYEWYSSSAIIYDVTKNPTILTEPALKSQIAKLHNPKAEYWNIYNNG